MLHRASLLSAALLLMVPLLRAQDEAARADNGDLVPNGSFEDGKGKLKRLGSIELAIGWTSPTESKADLFAESASEPLLAVPKNQFGDQSARTGTRYAGVRWWSQLDKQPRSYLQAQLKSPLQAGQKYCVRFAVSLGDLSRYASDEIGAYVSPIAIEKEDMVSLTYPAQVPAERTRVSKDMAEWQVVCGVFEAKGTEQFLLIGNFAATDSTRTEKMKRPKGEVRSQQMHAYYYIDDVSVLPIANDAQCACATEKEKVGGEFIFSRKSASNASLGTAEKVDAQTFYFKRFQADVDGSMAPWVAELAGLLAADTTLTVRLVGHADVKETDRTTLPVDRAEAIKAALVAAGTDAARITTAGEGTALPADPGTTEVAMSKNRRVEVELQP